MNKKFTMMLAAFVAAGYTITAEAGVVKVSKPVNGGTYYITNVAANLAMNGNETAMSNYSSDPGGNTNSTVLASVITNVSAIETAENLSPWYITSQDGVNYLFQVDNEEGNKLYEGYFAVKADEESSTDFTMTQNEDGTLTVTNTTKSSLQFPEEAGLMLWTGGDSKLVFYAKTTTLTSGEAIKIGDYYLSAEIINENAVLRLVDALEYSKNPLKWNISERGQVTVALGDDNTTYYLVSKDITKASEKQLALSKEATGVVTIETLTQDDKSYLVVANSAGASYFIGADLSLNDDVDITEIPISSQISDIKEAVLPDAPTSIIGGAVNDGLSGTYTKLYSYASGLTGYLVAGADGKVTVVTSPSSDIETYFWNYNTTSKAITAKDGTKLAVASETVFTQVFPEGKENVFFLQVAEKGYVKVTSTGLELADKPSEATAFSAVEENTVEFKGNEITAAAQGAFSLTYKIGNDEVDNLFKNVTAIDVTNSVNNYAEGTYFVVDAPDNMPLTYNSSDDYKALNKLTFVAISPVKSSNFVYEDENSDNGAGYTLTTVKGEDMVAYDADGVANGEITYNNAAFAVTKGELNTNELTVTPKTVFYVNGTEAEGEKLQSRNGVVIAAVKGANGSMFVSTFNTSSDSKIANDQTATLTPATAVKYSDFLGTEAKIYNIQFLSTTAAPATATTAEEKETKSECNKYLGVGQQATNLLAQGADFVDLSLPQNQWVVSEMTEDNVVTFTNRESGQEISSKLVKVADNEYRLAGCNFGTNTVYYMYLDKDNNNAKNATNTVTAKDNIIVKLTPVTATKNDGYVSGALSENDMVKIAFTPTSSVLVEDLYLTVANDKTTGLNKEGAAEFEVIKTAQKKTASHTTPIAVLKDGKPAVSSTVADTLNVVTYAFKQVIADKANYLNSAMSSMEEVTTPAQFMIKKLNNGKLALVSYTNKFDETIKSTTAAFDANLTTGKVDKNSNTLYSVAEPDAYISFVGQDAAISLPAKSQHVLFNNEGVYMAVNENNAAVIDGPSELKAEYTKEQLTFWLDTTDSEAIVPTFYITKGSKQFMFNAIDSLNRYNEGTASAEEVKAYMMPDNEAAARAIFRAATLKDSDTLTTSIKGESKDLTADKGIEAYQYKIILKDKAVADEYVVRSVKDGYYLYESNGAVGFTADPKQAIVFNIESTEAPTSNEGVSASDVKVVAQNGSVVVMNAAGKNVVVSTILGQVVVNEVLTSDNATISVPAGIVVVAVEGESFKVNVK